MLKLSLLQKATVHWKTATFTQKYFGICQRTQMLPCNQMKTQWNTLFFKRCIFTSHLQNKTRNHDICITDFSTPNQLLWKHQHRWKKANALNNVGKSFLIIWQSCPHSWETLQMHYGQSRNIAMHFTVFKCISTQISSSPVFLNKVHINPV